MEKSCWYKMSNILHNWYSDIWPFTSHNFDMVLLSLSLSLLQLLPISFSLLETFKFKFQDLQLILYDLTTWRCLADIDSKYIDSRSITTGSTKSKWDHVFQFIVLVFLENNFGAHLIDSSSHRSENSDASRKNLGGPLSEVNVQSVGH